MKKGAVWKPTKVIHIMIPSTSCQGKSVCLICADKKDAYHHTTSNAAKHVEVEKSQLEKEGGTYTFESVEEFRGKKVSLADCVAKGKSAKKSKGKDQAAPSQTLTGMGFHPTKKQAIKIERGKQAVKDFEIAATKLGLSKGMPLDYTESKFFHDMVDAIRRIPDGEKATICKERLRSLIDDVYQEELETIREAIRLGKSWCLVFDG